MVKVRWANGELSMATTWADLLQAMGQVQNPPMSEGEMKAVLATRARRWGSVIVSPTLPNGPFFKLLEQAGMITIIEEEEQ